jgi:hypothetical protein
MYHPDIPSLPSPGGGAGAGARYDYEQAEKRLQEQTEKAATEEEVEVEVEVLSSQIEALVSPSKPPALKKQKKGGDGASSSQPKKGGDGRSSSQAVELDSSDHEYASIGGEDFAVDEEQFEEQTRMQIDKSIDDIA